VVDKIKIRFRISSSVSEIFTANFKMIRNQAKFCMFLAPEIFLGCAPPKFLTGIIKLGLLLTIVQNFMPVGPRIMGKT